MAHNVPQRLIDPLIADISTTKRQQVAALQQYIQELLNATHHTFLQGSYRNHTAISDIPDVDIVAIRNSTYSGIHSPYRFNDSIQWSDIFSEIINVLNGQRRYDWTVTAKPKCIKISGTFNADIVPAVKIDNDHLVDPIAIRSDLIGSEKKTYPRQHIANGEAKHADTNNQFKPTVRMFKNWVKNHFGDSVPVSSFQIEALVCAVPNNNFSNDPVLNFINGGVAIQQKINNVGILLPGTSVNSVCGNENILQNWDVQARQRFTRQLVNSLGAAVDAYRATTITDAERNWRIAFNI